MNRHFSFLLIALCLLGLGLPAGARADSSHARIVRLSLVQGDVRFATTFHEDPLTDAKADWQVAALNLPLRQGFVLATDNGRAEVEFENGAMLFLGPNTVVEFYDLSLQDGARITRLVLRQGTATSYVNPANGDYFSLTGGDFTVEATGRATFRLDNFDDGSTVSIEQGHANVLRDNKTTPLTKGQSLSVHASDAADMIIGRTNAPDDFDHWVSGRIDSVVTATNYSSQYVNSPGYSAGFDDLYTYGSWYPMAWLRLLLAAIRHGSWLVAVRLWLLVSGSLLWQYLYRFRSLGLATLSLRRMAVFAELRLDVGAGRFRRRARPGSLSPADRQLGSQRQHPRHRAAASRRQIRKDGAKPEPGYLPGFKRADRTHPAPRKFRKLVRAA